MFKTKKEVDKHVTDILKKIKSDTERSLRGYCIAKLYYMIKEYDSARRYLSSFLSVKEKHAGGHKLMGQIFEDLNQYEKALQSYKRSLELDETQKDLVLKVCDLYCRVPVDVDRGRYWADRAELLFPHHKIIFQLRETLMKADGEHNTSELENLIASELAARPRDMNLRIKLLKLFLDTERVDLAYDHAIKVEAMQPFANCLEWYNCLEDIYEVYIEDEHHILNSQFFIYLLSCCDHLVQLTLMSRSIADSSDTLVKFDKYINKGRSEINDNSELWSEFLEHMQGQLYFHMGTFILKRAKLDQGKWKESSRMAAALLLTALSFEPDLKKPLPQCEDERLLKMIERCRSLASLRTSQAGHVVRCMSTNMKNWTQQIKQQCSSVQVKERIYQRIVGKSDSKSSSSYFLNSSTFSEVDYRVLSNEDLRPYDEECSRNDPGNLQLLVWLCLQIQECDPNSQNDACKLACIAFSDLQVSCSAESLTSGVPETLCQFDAEAFLLATVETSKCARHYRQSVLMMSTERPLYLPLIVSDQLCTSEQERWWTSTYQLLNNKSRGATGEMRRILQHGLEVIRGVGNHGLSVHLLVNLAKYFNVQSQFSGADLDSNYKVSTQRGIHYWNLAVSLLERLSSNLTMRYPKNRLFSSSLPEPSNMHVKDMLDEGNMCLANDALINEDFEKALKSFQLVNSAEAAFNQAMVYRKLAELETEGKLLDDVTSDMLERRNAFLVRARDCCYLTLDRIRGKKNHPLLADLNSEMKNIELMLQGLDDPSDVSSLSEEENSIPTVSGISYSTPQKKSPRSNIKNKFTIPSPQRLELQIKSLTVGQEQLVMSLQEQNKALIETNRAMVEELKINKSIMDQLKDEMTELHKDLSDLRISRESAPRQEENRFRDSEYIEEYIEDSYNGDGLLFHQQGPSNFSRHSGYPMNFADSMYRPPHEHRMPMPSHPNGYFPTSMGYPPSILRFAPSAGLPAHTPPSLYGHAQYMSPGNFPGAFPNALPEHQSYSLNQSQNSQLPAMSNIPTGMLTPVNSTPVAEPSLNKGALASNDIPTISSSSVNTPNTKQNTPSDHAAHPFQIAMPASAVTPTKSPFMDPLQQSTTAGSPVTGNVSSDKEADYVPKSPDFKPIIPLPDEVQVVTGEENELIQFSKQAKLYRFDNSQWKERGVGIVKILLNQEKKKARLIMRRDQIHRICANHQLIAGMNLIAKKGSNVTWIWCAQDYADEELKVEKFCIRFSDANCAAEFKKAFDTCVTLYGNALMSPKGTDKPKETRQVGFGDKFKQQAGSWECEICCVNNKPDAVACVACQTKPNSDKALNQTPGKGFTFTADTTAVKEQSFLDKLKSTDASSNKPTGFSFGTASTDNSGENKSGGFLFPKTTGFEFKSVKNNEPSEGSSGASPFPVSAVDNNNSSKVELGGFSFMKTPQIDVTKTDADAKSEKNQIKATSGAAAASPFAGFSFQPNKFSAPSANFENKISFGSKTDDSSAKTESSIFQSDKSPVPNSKSPNKSEHEEYEPSVDFKPVVPLPDLVDAKTGEENEEKLFGQRAKLFRYDGQAQQWKEKGVGEMKIMKHKDSDKFRILMRREQVLKLCANHYINGTLNLLPMENSDRSFVWCAADYSEQEVKNEKFAVKFKNRDIALQFKEEFQKCQKIINASSTSSAATSAPNTTSQTSLSFGDKFKPAAGSWECDVCCILNTADKVKCVACGTLKPGATAEEATVTAQTANFYTPPTGGFVFGTPAGTGSDSGQTGFSFGSKPAFSFGATNDTKNSSNPIKFGEGKVDAKTKTSDSNSCFKFDLTETITKTLDKEISDNSKEYKLGSPESYKFNFSGVKPTSPTKHSRTPKTSESHDEVEPSDADNISFQPVIPLPPQIEVKTGEEDEEVLYSQRAKLFRMVDKEWKERGIGDIKILWNKAMSKVRLVMRRETVLKLCCNHYLLPEMKFVNMDNRSYIWLAVDYSEEKPVEEKFAVRFKNADIATTFLQSIEDAKTKIATKKGTGMESDDQDSKPDTVNSKIDTKFTFNIGVNNTNQESKSSTVSVTSKEPKSKNDFKFKFKIEASKNDQDSKSNNPSSTTKDLHTASDATSDCSLQSFSFKLEAHSDDKAKDSTVSSQADEKKPVFGSNPVFSFGSQFTQPTSLPSSGFVFGQSKPPVFKAAITPDNINGVIKDEIDGCENSTAGDVQIIYEKKSSQKDIELARKYLLPDNFYSYKEKADCPGCRGCDDENKDESSSNNFGASSNTIDSFSNNFFPFSDLSDGLSFASLAGKASGFQKSSDENFTFAGAGSKLFQPATTGEKQADNEDEEQDPHFEPVIPLPEVVDIKTGEEDEEVLFSHRAKLYRFDPAEKMWKERGIGEIKVLKHRLQRNSFRILHRREQIHKLACNHSITSSTELKRLSTSLTAWCWSAVDFAEEDSKPANFSVKFKSEDTAHQFKKVVDECIKAMKSSHESTKTSTDPFDGDGIMFSSQVTLSVYDSISSEYQVAGAGNLVMSYNDEANGGRIQLYDSTDDNLICDHMVSMRMDLIVEDLYAYWSALDSSDLDSPSFKKFQITFSSADDVSMFSEAFGHAKEFADKSNIESEDQFYNPDETDNEDDDEDDDYDNESTIMFNKRVTLSIQDSNKEYKETGMGDLTIFYDDNLYGARIKVIVEDDKLVCDHMIAIQTTLRIDKNNAYWSALDSSNPNNAERKMFKAVFSSTFAAEEFEQSFNEGKELAVQSEIVENEDPK